MAHNDIYMDMPWPSHVVVGAPVALTLISGQTLKGRVRELEGDWMIIDGPGGGTAIHSPHVMAIGLDGQLPQLKGKAAAGGSTPRAAPVDKASIPADVVKTVVEAFLDGEVDRDIAGKVDLPQRNIKTLRQAFECARGNLVEDQISPAARELIPVLQEALCG